MHNSVAEAYKAYQILLPVAYTADAAASASNDVVVEDMEGDAMVTLNIGACTGTTVTGDFVLKGSLKATPTVFDQTLATFTQITEASDDTIACAKVNLDGIYSVAPNIDVSASGTPSFTVGMTLHARSFKQGASLNSVTPA